jgi:hypothetical protein
MKRQAKPWLTSTQKGRYGSAGAHRNLYGIGSLRVKLLADRARSTAFEREIDLFNNAAQSYGRYLAAVQRECFRGSGARRIRHGTRRCLL